MEEMGEFSVICNNWNKFVISGRNFVESTNSVASALAKKLGG